MCSIKSIYLIFFILNMAINCRLKNYRVYLKNVSLMSLFLLAAMVLNSLHGDYVVLNIAIAYVAIMFDHRYCPFINYPMKNLKFLSLDFICMFAGIYFPFWISTTDTLSFAAFNLWAITKLMAVFFSCDILMALFLNFTKSVVGSNSDFKISTVGSLDVNFAFGLRKQDGKDSRRIQNQFFNSGSITGKIMGQELRFNFEKNSLYRETQNFLELGIWGNKLKIYRKMAEELSDIGEPRLDIKHVLEHMKLLEIENQNLIYFLRYRNFTKSGEKMTSDYKKKILDARRAYKFQVCPQEKGKNLKVGIRLSKIQNSSAFQKNTILQLAVDFQFKIFKSRTRKVLQQHKLWPISNEKMVLYASQTSEAIQTMTFLVNGKLKYLALRCSVGYAEKGPVG